MAKNQSLELPGPLVLVPCGLCQSQGDGVVWHLKIKQISLTWRVICTSLCFPRFLGRKANGEPAHLVLTLLPHGPNKKCVSFRIKMHFFKVTVASIFFSSLDTEFISKVQIKLEEGIRFL